MILIPHVLHALNRPVHIRIHHTGLNRKHRESRIIEAHNLPQPQISPLAHRVRGEAVEVIHVRRVGIDIDDGSIRGRAGDEGTRCVPRHGYVCQDAVEEVFVADREEGTQWPGEGGIADEHVDFLARGEGHERFEGGIYLRGFRDVHGGGEDVYAGVLFLDGGLGVEEGLFAAAEEGNAGGACEGEGVGCGGADAGSASGDEDGLALLRELGAGGGDGGVGG